MSRNVNNDRRERLRAKQEYDLNKNKRSNFSVLDTSEYPDLEFMKIDPEVEYVLDILPYEVTTKNHPSYLDMKKNDFIMEDYCLEIDIHRGIGPKKKSVVCPGNYDRHCPICDEYKRRLDEEKQEALDSGLDDKEAYKKASQKDEVRNLKKSRRGIFVVRDKTDDEENPEMKLLDYSAFWFLDELDKKRKRKGILIGNLMFDRKSVVIVADTHKYRGKDGPGLISDIDFEKIGSYDFTEEDIANVPKLDKMLIMHTEEEITNMLWGNTSDDEEDDDEREEESKSSRRTRESSEEEESPRRRRPKEEDEEEPTPRRRRTSSNTEDEEDGGEKPRKRRRRREEPDEGDSSPECPEGLVFGKDIDSVTACDSCGVYESCDKEFNEHFADED